VDLRQFPVEKCIFRSSCFVTVMVRVHVALRVLESMDRDMDRDTCNGTCTFGPAHRLLLFAFRANRPRSSPERCPTCY
jgi:hypothetical protein